MHKDNYNRDNPQEEMGKDREYGNRWAPSKKYVNKWICGKEECDRR